MGDWTLYDSSGPARSGLTQDEAQALVDANKAYGITGVYALGPNGERID